MMRIATRIVLIIMIDITIMMLTEPAKAIEALRIMMAMKTKRW
jgi:hypothetical protein